MAGSGYFLFADHVHKFLIMEIYISDVWWNFLLSFIFDYLFTGLVCVLIIVSIYFIPCHHVLKTHIVFGQRPRLVRKYMLNLPQLLVEGARLHIYLRWLCCIEFRVANIYALNILDHLQRYYQ